MPPVTMFTPSSKEALNTVASFYSRFSQAGRRQAEEDSLGFKNAQNYRTNSLGRLMFTFVMLFQWGLIALTAYFGGVQSVLREWQDWEDVEVWHRLWSSSVPLWSVLIANGGVCLLSALAFSTRRIFLKTPKKPFAFLIIAVMSVSSFVFFLHPLDSVFYSGMLLIGVQNYFWLILMVGPRDRMAAWIHPFVHGQLLKTGTDEESDENSQILKSQKIENQV